MRIVVTAKERFVLAYGSRKKVVHQVRKGRKWSRSRKLTDYFFIHTQEAEHKQRK